MAIMQSGIVLINYIDIIFTQLKYSRLFINFPTTIKKIQRNVSEFYMKNDNFPSEKD